MNSLDIIEPKESISNATLTIYGYFRGGPVKSCCSSGTATPPYGSINPMNPKLMSSGDKSIKTVQPMDGPDVFQTKLNASEFGHTLGALKNGIGCVYRLEPPSTGRVQQVSRSVGFWDGAAESVAVASGSAAGGSVEGLLVERRTQGEAGVDVSAHIEEKMCFVLLPPATRTSRSPPGSLVEEAPPEEVKLVAMDSLEHWLTSDAVTLEQLVEYSRRQQKLATAELQVRRRLESSVSVHSSPKVTTRLSQSISSSSSAAAPTADPDPNPNPDPDPASLEVRLLLVPMMNMPAPTIRVTIASITKVEDGIVLLNINNKSYIQYQIIVRQGRLEWLVARRFSGRAGLTKKAGSMVCRKWTDFDFI